MVWNLGIMAPQDNIDKCEVESTISNIENSKLSGIEHNIINSNVLKLAHLFNCSLRDGKFPLSRTKGTITPIPKCGDPKLVGKWHPLALVPLPGTIM